MFNSKWKKAAVEELNSTNSRYEKAVERTIKDSERLYGMRKHAVEQLKKTEEFINKIANSPKEFEKQLKDVQKNYKKFEREVHEIEREAEKAAKVGGGVAGAGAVAGAGVAALGPTAAMAIATTFGTASTGTAIASLSGAAATNAALAWLGGGALAAGGGGMAAGNAFLALAGPVGWAIGGTAMAAGGLLANKKNKDTARKAEQETRKIQAKLTEVRKTNKKVTTLYAQVSELEGALGRGLGFFDKTKAYDYKEMTEEQRNSLKSLLNTAFSLSKKVVEKIQ